LKKAFLIGTAVFALAACGQKPADHAGAKSEAAAAADKAEIGDFGIALKDVDSEVRPGDNFYDYVNGEWLKTFKIPDEYSSYGSFTELFERSENRMKSIVDGLKSNAPVGSNEQKIRDFYSSYVDADAINAKGLAPLKNDFDRIEAIADEAALGAFMYDPSVRAKSPIAPFIDADLKDPTQYAVYLTQSGLGMPNRDYYLEEKFADKQAAYKAYIEKIMTLANEADPKGAAERIFDLETAMANDHWTPAKRRNRDLTYNPKSIDELEAFAPGAPWAAMFDAAGLSSIKSVVVREDDAIMNLADLMTTTPLSTWKEYLKFHLINSNAGVLPAEFDEANFAFYGTTLRGTPKQKERWKRALAAIDGSLGEAIGKIYVEKYFPPESKAKMEKLVANLKTALSDRIDHLDWMSADTKEKAHEKLAKFTTKIGYPDKWRDYSGLDIKPDDAFGNAARADKFEWAFEVSRLGGPVDRSQWEMTPQTVNAYYNPPLNEIVFPAAILQPPFFDPNADPAVNYGGIGAVIGHEISHGFDDQGRKSDGDGVLRDWWTNIDAEAFDARAKKLGDQYATYEVAPGFPVNPELTMGENIGDLGGMATAYEAYHLSLGGKDAPVIDDYTGDQRFFMAWAQVWKRAARDEQLKNQVASDPHSPAEFRVNGIVRNMDAWYSAFDVTPDEKLYLAPEDRAKIW